MESMKEVKTSWRKKYEKNNDEEKDYETYYTYC